MEPRSKIAIINPNTTTSMTEAIADAAVRAAQPSTQILAITSQTGPVSIEGYYDEAMSLPGLLQAVREADLHGVIGHVIACFDDTGLDAARQLARAPVVGIGQAGYHAACLVANRFSVVTTTELSVTALEHNILRYGLERRCASVRSARMPVLDLERLPEQAIDAIAREVEKALEVDRAEAIVLGCAGMAGLRERLVAQFDCPMIDGVSVAVGLIEMLNASAIGTSRRGGFAPANEKQITGLISDLLSH